MIAIEREKKKKIFSRWSCQLWFNYAAVIISWRQKKIFKKLHLVCTEQKIILNNYALQIYFIWKLKSISKKNTEKKITNYCNFMQIFSKTK